MITKNYIKQCEGAEEIQKAWKDKKSHVEDRIFIKFFDKDILITEEIEFYNDEETNKEYILFKKEPILPIPFYQYDDGELNVIYLPTQEQLQEMILNHGHHGYDNSGIATMLSLFSMDYKLEDLTFTELWLAFVMKEEYNKIWTGENWVKAE